jgi:hypothetical protein
VRHPYPTEWSRVVCSRLDSFPSYAAAKVDVNEGLPEKGCFGLVVLASVLPRMSPSWERMKERARKIRVFVAGTVRPSALAVSAIESPEIALRTKTSRKGRGSLPAVSMTF